MRNLLMTAFIGLIICSSSVAQEKFQGHLNVGYITPFTDFAETNFDQFKPNLAVDLGLSYRFSDLLRLRGNLLIGSMNATNGSTFHETTMLEPSASVDLDLMNLFNADSKLRLYGSAGLGFLLYNAKLFSNTNGDLLTQSPSFSSQKGYSPNGIGMASGILEYPLTEKLNLSASYGLRVTLFNDVIDGFENGSSNDYYGVGTIGLNFKLGHSTPPGQVAVDEDKYNGLNDKVNDLTKKNKELKDQQQSLAQLEMSNQEKDLKIAQLQSHVDSLESTLSNVDVVKQPRGEDGKPAAKLKTEYGEPAFRIIVMSMPSEKLAQEWIERGKLESDEMFIAYSEKVDSYRVIYKSFETYQAAKKELQNVKMAVPDAWILKF